MGKLLKIVHPENMPEGRTRHIFRMKKDFNCLKICGGGYFSPSLFCLNRIIQKAALIEFRFFPPLLGGNAHDPAEITVKGGQGGEAGPGGNGAHRIIGPLQFVAGPSDAYLVDVFHRGCFHAFHEDASEVRFAHMAHGG